MTERFKPESSMSEYESKRKEYSEVEKKTKLEIFKEFDPKLTELNNRVVSYLSEHGSNDIKELKKFNKEGKQLGCQFFDKVGTAGKDFNKKFEAFGLREFELSWLDLAWYRNDQREKRHHQDIKPIQDFIERKPPISEVRAMIEKAKAEITFWEKLLWENSEEKNLMNRNFNKNFIDNSVVVDAVEDKISDINAKNGLFILEHALEELKDERQEYTMEDYQEASEEAGRDYSGRSNNPNAGRARQQAADRRLRIIEKALKKSGQLEKIPEEKLTEELDQLYPDAKSRTVVEHQGKKYQIRYFPLETSRTGKTVFEWGHQWIPFSEESIKKSSSKRTKK